MSSGVKYDGGKPLAGILYEDFPNALMEIAKVATMGAKKYARNGWVDVPNNHERYTDAMHRHLLQEAMGEVLDEESGLRHAAHAAWGALLRLEVELQAAKDKADQLPALTNPRAS